MFTTEDIEDLLNLLDIQAEETDVKDELTCECGSETTYGKDTSHSSWCPKWTEDE